MSHKQIQIRVKEEGKKSVYTTIDVEYGDAVAKYGRLYTLYSIVNNAESNELKIRLRSKKWLNGLKT